MILFVSAEMKITGRWLQDRALLTLLTGADSDLCSQPEPEGVLVLTQKLLDQQEESVLRSESQNQQLGSLLAVFVVMLFPNKST